MGIKKLICLVVALAWLQGTQIALAIPAGGPSATHTATFYMGGGTATVESGYFLSTSTDPLYLNKYVYTYQITNVNTGINISFFSVGIKNGGNVDDLNFEVGTVNPLTWTPVIDDQTQQVQSVEALFSTPIKNSKTSALLWFVGDLVPTSLGLCALAGTQEGIHYYATDAANDFPVPPPVPEPATVVLLAIGGVLTAHTRKRRAA